MASASRNAEANSEVRPEPAVAGPSEPTVVGSAGFSVTATRFNPVIVRYTDTVELHLLKAVGPAQPGECKIKIWSPEHATVVAAGNAAVAADGGFDVVETRLPSDGSAQVEVERGGVTSKHKQVFFMKRALYEDMLARRLLQEEADSRECFLLVVLVQNAEPQFVTPGFVAPDLLFDRAMLYMDREAVETIG